MRRLSLLFAERLVVLFWPKTVRLWCLRGGSDAALPPPLALPIPNKFVWSICFGLSWLANKNMNSTVLSHRTLNQNTQRWGMQWMPVYAAWSLEYFRCDLAKYWINNASCHNAREWSLMIMAIRVALMGCIGGMLRYFSHRYIQVVRILMGGGDLEDICLPVVHADIFQESLGLNNRSSGPKKLRNRNRQNQTSSFVQKLRSVSSPAKTPIPSPLDLDPLEEPISQRLLSPCKLVPSTSNNLQNSSSIIHCCRSSISNCQSWCWTRYFLSTNSTHSALTIKLSRLVPTTTSKNCAKA